MVDLNSFELLIGVYIGAILSGIVFCAIFGG